MWARHCDYEHCDSWQQSPGTITQFWIEMNCLDDPNWGKHFCSANCLTNWTVNMYGLPQAPDSLEEL